MHSAERQEEEAAFPGVLVERAAALAASSAALDLGGECRRGRRRTTIVRQQLRARAAGSCPQRAAPAPRRPARRRRRASPRTRSRRCKRAGRTATSRPAPRPRSPAQRRELKDAGGLHVRVAASGLGAAACGEALQVSAPNAPATGSTPRRRTAAGRRRAPAWRGRVRRSAALSSRRERRRRARRAAIVQRQPEERPGPHQVQRKARRARAPARAVARARAPSASRLLPAGLALEQIERGEPGGHGHGITGQRAGLVGVALRARGAP